MLAELRVDDEGVARCWWCGDDPLYAAYHDTEWGRPLRDDDRWYEKICLEGFQAGLSWITILRKRENFRAAFAGFHIDTVASFDEGDVERLLGDAGIVRHRGKIESAINNARRAVELRDEIGSIGAFMQQYRSPRAPGLAPDDDVDATSPESVAMSKALRRRGWSFVGPTTMYAMMQSAGLVNDHHRGCHVFEEIAAAR
ncbi:MAG: DNA-3-methyladenine glycosylase I [Ilumatobacteraceae bacterium]